MFSIVDTNCSANYLTVSILKFIKYFLSLYLYSTALFSLKWWLQIGINEFEAHGVKAG